MRNCAFGNQLVFLPSASKAMRRSFPRRAPSLPEWDWTSVYLTVSGGISELGEGAGLLLEKLSRLFNGSNRQLTPPIIANKNSQFTQLAVAQQRNVFRRSPCIKCLRAVVRLQSVLGVGDNFGIGCRDHHLVERLRAPQEQTGPMCCAGLSESKTVESNEIVFFIECFCQKFVFIFCNAVQVVIA